MVNKATSNHDPVGRLSEAWSLCWVTYVSGAVLQLMGDPQEVATNLTSLGPLHMSYIV